MGQAQRPPSFDGADNPLAFAVNARDKDTLEMVRQAIARKDVMLAFQPVMQARGPIRVAFHEGLIRVLDQTGRVIPARDFIGVVETQELGRQIDTLALEKGLQALHDVPDLRLSINMSARSIGYATWRETLDRALHRDPTLADRLILEITEASAMTVPDLVTGFMADLHRKGISFALDDFGAGFTSFRYLRDFYFDILKIDGQFIRNVATDPDNQVLAQALIMIGQQFDMFTVAESVETQADADFLTACGVDCLQGYLYAAPTTTPDWAGLARKARRAQRKGRKAARA